GVIRLGQVVGGAGTDQPDRLGDIAVGGGEHHRRAVQVGRHLAIEVFARTVRQTDVGQHESGAQAGAAHQLDGLRAVLHPLHRYALQMQALPQGSAEHGVVLDDQYIRIAHDCCWSILLPGRRTAICVPLPDSSRTRIRPFKLSTRSWTMSSPIRSPGGPALPNAILACAGRPPPWSATCSTRLPARARATTCTVCPAGDASTALSTRLSNIWRTGAAGRTGVAGSAQSRATCTVTDFRLAWACTMRRTSSR